jgi:hypothetical protein
VAATGLLGFNPYGKSVALDFSSKPTQLAIQLGQREQAKKEALDKYLMDYEKSINSAGMRKAESDIFLKKLADNKAFYIQNRDKILNPAKYGYDAQSQYMSNFKDMTGLIDQSKQAAANDKITTQHFIAQKNLNAPDGYAEAVEASHLPITDPRYRPLDVTQFKFWKSHDPFEFGKELKTLNTIPGKPELMKEGNYQYQRTPMEADINNLKSFSYNKLGDVGYVKMLQNLSNEEVGQLRNVYRQRMNAELPKGDAKELSLAYTLTNLPKDYTQTNLVEQPSYTRAQQDAYIRRRKGEKGEVVEEYSPEEHVSAIFRDADDSIKSLTVEGKNIEGVRVQLPEEVASKYERKIGNTKFSPDFFYMTNDKKDIYPIYLDPQGKKTKSGANVLDVKLSERIPVETNLIPTMGKVFGGQTYTRKNLYTTGDGKSGASKVVGTKGSAGINWEKK